MTIGALFFSAAFVFGEGAVKNDTAITAVAGESWLHHLHRSFDETSMGKTWHLGPPDATTEQRALLLPTSSRPDSPATRPEKQIRTLHGSDLYRLNCQGCHGESGAGAPPEIGSLINPVRATSALLVGQRMKQIGMELNHQQIAEMANQSKGMLLQRLHEGGHDMPSFHHLSEAEIRSLVAYLRLLAGVPGAEREQTAIRESDARIGELIVKSTCHTCHDATGVNPAPAVLLEGAIPPLSALPERVDQALLVRKVTSGAPVIMGTPSSSYRGRMPVFSYLSQDEVADVYDYLTHYPPTALADSDQLANLSHNYPPDSANDSRQATTAATVPVFQTPPAPLPTSAPQDELSILPFAVGPFAIALLALGGWITWREFKRLSNESQTHSRQRDTEIDTLPLIEHPLTAEALGESPFGENIVAEGTSSDWMDERRVS